MKPTKILLKLKNRTEVSLKVKSLIIIIDNLNSEYLNIIYFSDNTTNFNY